MDDASTLPPAHRPLQGVRVLDLTRYLPGPFCALHLGWLGAEVTVVEQPPHGDPMRAIPPVDDAGVSLAYRSLRRDASVELLDGDQHSLFRRVEAHVRARGLGELVDSWEPDVPLMRGEQ